MKAFDAQHKPSVLARFVACSIMESDTSLETLQMLTGLHRSRLGRMRQGRESPSLDEAELVFRAVGKRVLALVLVTCLSDECIIAADVFNCLANYRFDRAAMIERLDRLGTALNPQWASGRANHLARLLVERDSADGVSDIQIRRSSRC